MSQHHSAEPHVHGPRLRDSVGGAYDDLDGVKLRPEARIPIELDDPETRARRAAILPEEWARFETNMAEMLTAFGANLDKPGTKDTPRRFVRALFDSTEGYDGDPKLVTVFAPGLVFAFFCGMMVLQLLWVKFMVPETKGVPLEQIQQRLGLES